MNRRFSLLAVAIAVVTMVFASGAATAAEVTLKAVSAFAQGTNFSRNFESFIERVNATGKGVVQINYIGGGGKVMSPFEVGNAVRTRVVDIGNLPGAFYTNLMPEADALKLTSDAVHEMKANGTFDFLNTLHNDKVNAHLLGRHKAKVPFHLYLTKPIQGMDLKGLKIRVTPIYRAFFASMGASLIRTAPGEVFTALERGVVDGYGWPTQGIFDLGWHEVTKYRVDPGFYAAAVEVLVNKDAWDGLGAEQKAVLEAAAKWMEETGDAEDAGINKSEIARQDKQGIQTIAFTGADGETYLKRAMETAWEAVKKASPEHGDALERLLAK